VGKVLSFAWGLKLWAKTNILTKFCRI
jgi:hypothetical protein